MNGLPPQGHEAEPRGQPSSPLPLPLPVTTCQLYLPRGPGTCLVLSLHGQTLARAAPAPSCSQLLPLPFLLGHSAPGPPRASQTLLPAPQSPPGPSLGAPPLPLTALTSQASHWNSAPLTGSLPSSPQTGWASAGLAPALICLSVCLPGDWLSVVLACVWGLRAAESEKAEQRKE